jgi:hypothetical protein
MPVNDKIKFADYNSIRAKLVGVLGAGVGSLGYGQPIISSDVNISNTVSVNEWANLRYDIINARVHQTGAVPSILSANLGNSIKYDAPNAPVLAYDQLADTIISERFQLGAGQFASSVPSSPVSQTAGWSNSVSCVIQFFWATADQARYFFNSGGKVRISASRSGGSATQQNSAWTSLLNAVGTQEFGGNTNATNWYQCTSSFQQFYVASSSSPYGNNNYRLLARSVNAANNNSGTASSGEILAVFTDGYIDPGTSATDSPNTIDIVNGTLTVTVDLIYATGTLFPASAGSFTVVRPTVILNSIQGS